MTHIIIKSHTPANIHGKPALQEPVTGPFVIDFGTQKKSIPASFLLKAFAIFCSFFFTALVAIILITTQSSTLARHLVPEHETVESAFPLDDMVPPEGRAKILGRDFQQHKNTPPKHMTEQDLIPILEKLPLYGPAPTPKRVRNYINVSEAPKSPSTFQKEADAAYASGDIDAAIKAAGKALAIEPANIDLKQNLTALLLEKARVAEELGKWQDAMNAYGRAAQAAKGQPELVASIRARLEYVKAKATED